MNPSEKDIIVKILQSLVVEEKPTSTPNEPEEEYFIKEGVQHIEKLKSRKASFDSSETFNIGDIVVWKEGLKNKRVPLYKQPCIVVAKNNPPLIEEDATYSESLDIKIGHVSDQDEFLVFNYDSKRFTRAKY
jgi:hypothetical protein